ncbi:hypothetical protein BSLG_003919 [Batrachochytrium salamandrivorans]|nr:hypothetical protein BSLG_003998 [Batrachochytrium salamandrivorans]KAJ1341491.1 hypothetical protein BSLG_003919 [Batrachochytrium salamandrivorans]
MSGGGGGGQYHDQHDQHRHSFQHRQFNHHQQKPYDRQPQRGRMLAGDWICQMCQKHNFASRQQCFQCGANGAGAVRHVDRPGDWKCPSCTYLNFASRTACYKCSAQKAGDLVQNNANVAAAASESTSGSTLAAAIGAGGVGAAAAGAAGGAVASTAPAWDAYATGWTAPATDIATLFTANQTTAAATSSMPAIPGADESATPNNSGALGAAAKDAPLAAAADAAWLSLVPLNHSATALTNKAAIPTATTTTTTTTTTISTLTTAAPVDTTTLTAEESREDTQGTPHVSTEATDEHLREVDPLADQDTYAGVDVNADFEVCVDTHDAYDPTESTDISASPDAVLDTDAPTASTEDPEPYEP